MGPSFKYCPHCGTEISEGAIFCPTCGINLQTEFTIGTELPPPPDERPLTLDEDAISRYLDLEAQLSTLDGMDVELQERETALQHLIGRVERGEARLREAEEAVNREWEDVEKLQKFSWRSLKAKLKGTKEEDLEREQAEYYDALNALEAARAELEHYQSLLAKTRDQARQLRARVERQHQLAGQLRALIDAACEGVADPVEDRVEQELAEIDQERRALAPDRNRLHQALSLLDNASADLDAAYARLRKARSTSTWDLFGGGLIVDSIKHSRMADARDYVQRANYSLDQVQRVLGTSSQLVHVERLSFFWDGFMDGLFTDMLARGKINRSLDNVERARQQTWDLRDWVGQQLREIDARYEALEQRARAKREELTRERRRMIEEYLRTHGIA